jgi:peroxiredoxin
VVAVAPSPVREIQTFMERFELPFPCLADPELRVFDAYGVGSSLWSLGQRPAVFLLGPKGECLAEWRGKQQWDIPSLEEIMRALPGGANGSDSPR